MSNPFECIANGNARYFAHRGINCMTQLGPYSINGYIELPENHPWLDFPDTLEVHPDIEVHGGITYHEGRVIGFDTNHLGDGHHPDAPNAYPSHFTGRIWTWEEVEAETRKLADQAKDTHTMTNPTRQEILDAHEALERLERTAQEGVATLTGEKTITIRKNLILAVLPPKPAPTMAEVEWLDGVHWLAEAEHKDGRIVIMLTRDSSERISFIWNESLGATHPQNLTPTGRLYTLTEVQE